MPLGVVLLPTLSREVAIGEHAEYVGAARARPAGDRLRDAPDRGARPRSCRRRPWRSCSPRSARRPSQLTAATLLAFLVGLVAHALIAVLARAFYARQDTLTPVLAAVVAVVVNTILAFVLVDAARAARASPWPSPSPPGSRPARCSSSCCVAPGLGLRRSAAVALRTRSRAAAGGGRGLSSSAAGRARRLLAGEPTGLSTVPGLLVDLVVVGAAFGVIFLVVALALRIAELRSIVGIMVDALRRPRRA